jgi:dolichol-phosphate mannosyltransferase
LPLDCIVVDDGSADGTQAAALAKAAAYGNIKVVPHEVNKGFAAALKTGIRTALADGYEGAIFMDCDQTHDPDDLPAFIAALDDGADVVIGSRYVGHGHMEDVPWHRVWISVAGNVFGKVVFRLPVRDASSGYRALNRRAMETIRLEQNDFSIQLEEVLRARKAGLRFTEIPIVLVNRKLGSSKFTLNLKVFWRYWILLVGSLFWKK